jgi:DNA-binding MarR family transcriptional regulator
MIRILITMRRSHETGSVLGLIAQCHLTWRRYLQRRLRKHGITLKQYYVLARLSENTSLQPMKLAELLYCDRPTVSIVIRNMRRKGWVDRSIDAGDARHIQVVITRAGREKLSAIRRDDVFAGSELAKPLEIFSQSEISDLENGLSRLLEHMKQAAG